VFAVGETTALPPLYVYVFAPVGAIVNDFPAQIDPLLTDITGCAFTVTDETAVFELTQPAALVPVTE
jgi:hypothetical protein